MAHHHHHHHHREEEQQQEGYGYGYGSSPFPASDPVYSAPPVESPYLNPPADAYGHQQQGYYDPYARQQQSQQGYYDPSTTVKYEREQVYYDSSNYERERKEEKRREHLGEASALAAGAFALYERHEVKVDPENARRHKIEEEIAEATAVGGAGYAIYEHHEMKKTERQEEAVEGKHHHHRWF